MVEMSEDEFEGIVADVLDELPQQFIHRLENVVFLVVDQAEPQQGPPDILGLYEGFAQTDGDFGPYAEPNRIFIFRKPLLEMCSSVEEVCAEVKITVFHEIAHHFGSEEEDLMALGWA